jgi:hypothetical protein
MGFGDKDHRCPPFIGCRPLRSTCRAFRAGGHKKKPQALKRLRPGAIAHCQLQTFPPVKIPKIGKVVVGSAETGFSIHNRYLLTTVSHPGLKIKTAIPNADLKFNLQRELPAVFRGYFRLESGNAFA